LILLCSLCFLLLQFEQERTEATEQERAPVNIFRRDYLRRRGVTELPDVYLIHEALAAQGSSFPFQQLFVPEPLSLQLGAAAAFALLAVKTAAPGKAPRANPL
jgi:hypothetical protein